MKKHLARCLLLIVSLVGASLSAQTDPAPPPTKEALVETHLLHPLLRRPAAMYSRRRLDPPACTWGPNLTETLQSFTITYVEGTLLGLFDASARTLWILDPAQKTYVPPGDHPLFHAQSDPTDS